MFNLCRGQEGLASGTAGGWVRRWHHGTRRSVRAAGLLNRPRALRCGGLRKQGADLCDERPHHGRSKRLHLPSAFVESRPLGNQTFGRRYGRAALQGPVARGLRPAQPRWPKRKQSNWSACEPKRIGWSSSIRKSIENRATGEFGYCQYLGAGLCSHNLRSRGHRNCRCRFDPGLSFTLCNGVRRWVRLTRLPGDGLTISTPTVL